MGSGGQNQPAVGSCRETIAASVQMHLVYASCHCHLNMDAPGTARILSEPEAISS